MKDTAAERVLVLPGHDRYELLISASLPIKQLHTRSLSVLKHPKVQLVPNTMSTPSLHPSDLASLAASLLELGLRPSDPIVTTEAEVVEASTWRITRERPALGTKVSVTLLVHSRDLAAEATAKAFDEMDRLIQLLSRHDSVAAVATLNDIGKLVSPPHELISVLDIANRMHKLSSGAFDITVAPLVDYMRDKPDLEPTAIITFLELVGAKHVQHDHQSIRLGRPGMQLTLDGIAKGFIVDRMAAILLNYGVTRFLINAGGDIRSLGHSTGQQPWRIAVKNPGEPEIPFDTLALDAGCVATSGDYEICLETEGETHHIVDARSGLSPVRNRSVTVLAPSTAEADALATTVFLMRPEEGLRLVESLNDSECLILRRQGAPLSSGGWNLSRDPKLTATGTAQVTRK